MSDTPESLSAILAEMRDERIVRLDGADVTRCLLLNLADRIEAAAERERDEDRQLAAIAESDESFARCARCDRPERAPGNAAALREALIAFVNSIQWLCDGDERGIFKKQFMPLLSEARAALAAPARNCDICRTKREAKMEYDSRHGAEYGSKDDFMDWLFRPAEEGGEK